MTRPFASAVLSLSLLFGGVACSPDLDAQAGLPANGGGPSREPAESLDDDFPGLNPTRAALAADARVDAALPITVRDAGAGAVPMQAIAPDTGRTRSAESEQTPMLASDGGAVQGADAELEALRQLCVDEINRYRASVNVAPLARAQDREVCSDNGAKLDGDTGRAHASATAGGFRGNAEYCPQSAQDACPGWPVGPRSGYANVAAALKGCLKMMWDEGAPPSGAPCSGLCYQQHGHYLNMSAPATKRVACGFYKMKNGSWWMNQNFW